MRFFGREKDESVIIIGCGRLGRSLAYAMSGQGQDVTVIDRDENALKRLPSSYRGSVLNGDGTDTDILELAGIRNACSLIAATSDEAANIMIAQIARQRYQIKNVLAYIDDISKTISCQGMNIITVCPTVLSVNEAQRVLFNVKEEKAV